MRKRKAWSQEPSLRSGQPREAHLSPLRGKVVQVLCRLEMPRFYLSVVMRTRESTCVSEDVDGNSSLLVT